jgi:hypothetical protein
LRTGCSVEPDNLYKAARDSGENALFSRARQLVRSLLFQERRGEVAMNIKRGTVSLVASIIIFGVGCTTLPRPEVARPTTAAGERRVALASGPAVVQLSSYGIGTAKLYLADDPGTGATTCPAAETDQDGSMKVLDGDDYAGDVPVPAGKRICAVIDHPQLGIDWLAENFAPPPAPATPAAPVVAPKSAPVLGTLIARK